MHDCIARRCSRLAARPRRHAVARRTSSTRRASRRSRAERRRDAELVPAVEAAFARESYRAGEHARSSSSRISSTESSCRSSGPGPSASPRRATTVMNGVPGDAREALDRREPGAAVVSCRRRLGQRALLRPARAADGRVGFAPFVVAPRADRRAPRRRRPADADLAGLQLPGRRRRRRGDSWYADKQREHPFGSDARTSTAAFPTASASTSDSSTGSRWSDGKASTTSRSGTSSRSRAPTRSPRLRPHRLRRPPRVRHDAEYDLVEGFRDLGGNLMFLSANNFFWRVDREETSS